MINELNIMTKTGGLFIFALFLFNQCTPVKKQAPESKDTDPHSYAVPEQARVKHLNWKASVDFDTKVITAVATWDIESNSDADLITFDTRTRSIPDGSTRQPPRAGTGHNHHACHEERRYNLYDVA
jgi:hypothetical protein